MKKARLTAGVLLLALALGMTACGDDSSTESTNSAAASTEAATEAETTEAATTEAATTEAATTEAATEEPKEEAVLPTSYADSYCKKFSERYSDEALTMDCTMKMNMLGTELNYKIYATYSKEKNAM